MSPLLIHQFLPPADLCRVGHPRTCLVAVAAHTAAFRGGAAARLGRDPYDHTFVLHVRYQQGAIA